MVMVSYNDHMLADHKLMVYKVDVLNNGYKWNYEMHG